MKIALLALSFVFLACATCLAQTPAAAAKEITYERSLIPVQNIFAPTVVTELTKIFNDGNGPNITAVADQSANAILISAPADTLKEISALVARLDRPAPIISIDVWFVDLDPDSGKAPEGAAAKKAELLPSGSRKVVLEKLSQMEKDGRAAVVNHFQITTMSNQPAFAQQGEKKPKVTATTSTKSGRVSTASYENTGTIVRVQPRVNAENLIVMSIDAEKSLGGPESKGIVLAQPEQGPEVRATSNIAVLGQSTVSLRAGEILSVTGLTTTPDAAAGSYQVLVAAEVLPEAAAK